MIIEIKITKQQKPIFINTKSNTILLALVKEKIKTLTKEVTKIIYEIKHKICVN